MSKTHNLFISHSWQHSDSYVRLKALLDQRGNFKYINHSIPKDDPVHTNGSKKELRQAIHNRMKPCHAIIVLAGVYASYSDWIEEEMIIAKLDFTNPKPIIGIKPFANKVVSVKVSNAAAEIVGWNTESVIRAIRQYSIA